MTRRFEFEEGGSSKFWEVSVDGSDMTVNYGRIGTSGQSKTKGFASGDAAQKEADKLILEKTKKGYQEVGATGASPTPKPAAPAPKPAVAPKSIVAASAAVAEPAETVEVEPVEAPAAIATARNVPTAMVLGEMVSFDPPAWAKEEGESSVHTPMRARKAPSFAETWKPLLSRYKSWEQYKQLIWPEGDAFFDRVRARLDAAHEGEGFDVDLEAYTYVLSDRVSRYGSEMPEAQTARALAHWTARTDAVTALRTLFRTEWLDRGNAATPVFLVRDAVQAAAMQPEHHLLVAVHEHARMHGIATLEATLRALLQPTNPARRAALAFLLEDEAEASLAISEARAHRLTAVSAVLGIAPNASDAGEVLNVTFYPAKAMRAVLRHGLSLAEAVFSRPNEDRLAVIACYPSLLAARALVPMLEAKSSRKRVGQALANMPTHALAALNEAKSKKTKYRDAIDALIATLSTSQAAATSESSSEHATSGLHIEAALSDAPRVFQAPPWRAKKKTSKDATFDGLVPRVIEPVVDVSSLDPKALAKESQLALQYQRVSPEQLIENLNTGKYVEVRAVLTMSAAELETLRLAGVLPRLLGGEYWTHDTYTPGLTAILAREGIASFPALLALVPALKGVLASELGYVGAVEVGPLAIQWLGGKATRKAAEQWVRRFPRYAAAALVPIALSSGAGKAATERDRARALLITIGKSHRDIILEEARHHGAAVESATSAVLDADPLEFAPSKPPKVMDGLESLPRIALRDGRLLPVECNAVLLEMLAFTAMDPPYAGIEQTKAACDPRSLDVFVEALVRTWVAAGMPTAHEWAVRAVAVIGTDKAARFLFDRARAWAQDNQKQRALLAIDVLGAMGTDLSLSLVGRMSRSSLRQYMKDRATELLAEIASNRGLSSDELEDRTAPDLGLDAQGTIVLDFGPRAFRVGFDEHLTPFVQTSEGERLDAFPRPNKNDDAAKAKAASEAWKMLKSEAEKVSRDQVARLERMMADERRVDAEVFVDSFVNHPLVGHLTKRLIWGAFDAQGALLQSFRVSEDKSLASIDDELFTLPAEALIGLVHPYTLRTQEGLTARWGQVLADYAVMQPFGQLSRPEETFAVEAVGTRYADKKAPTSLLYTLRSHGWRASVGEYAEIEGFTRTLGDYQFRLSLRQPMVNGEPSKLHDVSISTWSEGEAAKPSAVQLAELVYRLDQVIVA
jgi:predicted DNA-binding WGR domain protein